MTEAQTLKMAFPRGHTSFSFYSGSVDLAAYDYAHIHEQDTKGNSLRVTLFRDKSDAEQRHGKDIRKLYSTLGKNAPEGGKVYKTLTGPTRRFFGFEREKNYLFGRVQVPVHKVSENERETTYDIDLTDSTIKALIRNGIRRGGNKSEVKATGVPKVVKTKVKAESTSATNALVTKSATPTPVAKAMKVGQLTLPAGTTIADLKKLNFQVMIVDANEQPFAVTVQG